MKSNRTLMVVLFGSAFVLFGCDKSEPKADTTAQPQATATAENKAGSNTMTNTAPNPAPAIADSDLATSADFEEQAEKDISAKNYKGELTSLESEVSKE